MYTRSEVQNYSDHYTHVIQEETGLRIFAYTTLQDEGRIDHTARRHISWPYQAPAVAERVEIDNCGVANMYYYDETTTIPWEDNV